MKAIIGKKIGMTRIFDEKGNMVPVTLLMVEPNVVTNVFKNNKVQIGPKEEKKINKPLEGNLKKANTRTKTIKEFQIEGDFKIGDKIDISQFEVNDKVSVKSVSKGKGFSGTVKRHGFSLGPKTHGSDSYRRPGAIGSVYPQRVIKGKKMAGHLGHQNTTVKNLKIAFISKENNILMLKGAVPGPNKSVVFIFKK